jgi:uncharacterized protein YeaO (DUF488 family)
MAVALKRVYDPPSPSDGARVLVDRLWPRGISKDAAKLKLWLKDIAPSDELRKWYHTRPTQWLKFREKYLEELSSPEAAAALDQLHELAHSSKKLTLLYGSRNTAQNNATVLKELLDGTRKPPRSTGAGAAAAVRQRARAR